MTNTKHTKRALLASVLSLLLCISMLVGSTFAWFTDSASTGVSNIVAGTLDIGLYTDEACTVPAEMLSFKKAAGAENEAVLFEPGAKYELTRVWLKNDGNLHAKYQVVINGISGENKLAEVLDVIIDGQNMGTLKDLIANAGIVKTHHIAPTEVQTFGKIELMMQTTAGNDYQGQTIDGISITVLATQYTAENDSYGDQYDANAEWPIVGDVWDGTDNDGAPFVPEKVPAVDPETGDPVVDPETGDPVYEDEKSDNQGVGDGFDRTLVRITTAEQLAELATLVNNGEKFTNYNFELMTDIDLANKEWTPIGKSTATPFGGNFNGNGHTIYNLKVTGGEYAGLFGYVKGTSDNYQPSISDLTIENVTITGADNAGAIAGGAVYAQRNTWYGGVQVYKDITLRGDVKIEGTNVGGIIGSSWLDVRIAVENITVDVNDGSYIKGTAYAGGVFAAAEHVDSAKNITSNIDVIGNGIVGGIAADAAWNWDNITCTGNVTLNTTSNETGKYSIATVFGNIAENTYWGSTEEIVVMSNLTGSGTLTINLDDGTVLTSNGRASNLIGDGWYSSFDYVNGKVVVVQ